MQQRQYAYKTNWSRISVRLIKKLYHDVSSVSRPERRCVLGASLRASDLRTQSKVHRAHDVIDSLVATETVLYDTSYRVVHSSESALTTGSKHFQGKNPQQRAHLNTNIKLIMCIPVHTGLINAGYRMTVRNVMFIW